MNYYKPLRQCPPEEIVSRSNRLFLGIIGLYLVIAGCGLAVDMTYYHTREDRIYYLVENRQDTDNRITADLLYYGQQKYYPEQTNSSILNVLKFEIVRNSQNELTVKIRDSKESRFELPDREEQQVKMQPPAEGFRDLKVQIADEKSRFCLRIDRGHTQSTILNISTFIFADKLIEWATSLDSEYLWGLGQRNSETFRLKENGNYTIWNKSQPPGQLDDGRPDHQANGFHPMYLRKEASDSQWHIILIKTSSGIGFDYRMKESLRFKMLGGIFFLKIFIGQSPGEVIEAYHRYLGGYVIPPFWATGYHQSRRGYNNSDMLIEVWKQFKQYQLPVDAIWSDVDYMKDYEAFTIDGSRFNTKQMNAQLLNQSQKGVKWVPTVPMGIHTQQPLAKDYEGLWVQSGNYNNKPLVGCGLAGTVYFPDYNNPNTALQLIYSLKTLMEFVPFQGVHLVGSQLYNAIDGQAVSIKEIRCNVLSQIGVNSSNGVYNQFNLTITNRSNLNQRSLPLNAKHYGSEDSVIKGSNSDFIVEYNFHNLNSYVVGKAAYESIKRLDIRHPLVMSTSSFFGMGKYGGHIVEDSTSDFSSMVVSLPSIFNFQLFGMPFTGVDICGKQGNATAEVCARWMALGCMYPFSRNHNGLGSNPQEPYVFVQPFVLEASRNSLRLRYSLLKYYYSVYAISYGVGTVFSPLFVEFPDDPHCLDVETEAMIGPALLITPVLLPSKGGNFTVVKAYFPEGGWFSIQHPELRFLGSSTLSFNVSLNESCPTFLREGYMVIYQETELADGTNITRTYELDNKVILLIALMEDDQGSLAASGFLVSISNYSDYMDRCVETGQDCVINVQCSGSFVREGQLELTVEFDVQFIDTFTDLIVTGMKLYVQNFKTKEALFDEPIKIDSETHSFTKTLEMEPFGLGRQQLLTS